MAYKLSDWSHVRMGQPVRVFMGSGWVKGVVKSKQPERVAIQVDKRTVVCYDPRNVRPA